MNTDVQLRQTIQKLADSSPAAGQLCATLCAEARARSWDSAHLLIALDLLSRTPSTKSAPVNDPSLQRAMIEIKRAIESDQPERFKVRSRAFMDRVDRVRERELARTFDHRAFKVDLGDKGGWIRAKL